MKDEKKKKRGQPFIKTGTLSQTDIKEDTLELSQDRHQSLREYSTFFNNLKKSLEVASIADKEKYYKNYIQYNFLFLPFFALIMFFDKSLLSFSFMSITLVKDKISNKELSILLKENPSVKQLMLKKLLLFSFPLRYFFSLRKEIRDITGYR